MDRAHPSADKIRPRAIVAKIETTLAAELDLQREGGNAVLDIQDSAPGVESALLPKLFERFFRVESSRSRSSGGSGLGLSICESIVLAHAGSIRAMPSPLGGLWIQVQLPLAPTQPTRS